MGIFPRNILKGMTDNGLDDPFIDPSFGHQSDKGMPCVMDVITRKHFLESLIEHVI